MDSTNTAPKLDLLLDVFGQRLVTIFTQIGFCFPTRAGCEPQDIISVLTQGTQRLAKSFPWLAGQVVCEGATEANTGVFKIKPLDAAPRLFVKDLRDDLSIPSMDDMRQSGFPMGALDETIFAPRKTISGTPSEAIAEVFQLQASIIRGGLVLTFLGQHQSMDGIGQAQVISLFSKACRNEDFTEEELRIGNLAPENTVRLLDSSWNPGPELSHNIVKKDLSQPGPGSLQSKMPTYKGAWAHFNVSASALEALKAEATQTLPPDSSFVSTDDALSAFVWRSISKIRLAQFTPTTKTQFSRAVDLRRYLDIPQTHPGFVQSMTYHDFTMQQLVHGPLGAIAADLRAAVDPATSNLAYHGRSLATLISRTPNKKLTSFIAGFDLSKDVMLSSWANQNSYELDFGLGLGRPEAVRRPRFADFPGLVYLLPRSAAGDIGIAMSLSADEMDLLSADEEFAKYATYIG
ncbi:trichothecene 3-o-acetyltransferase [Trichoderma arundinaceum]|uniref:Trichothecene 3-o-acetyltransferase n=1 Tax=Trichoderma arundinaceum TaxID=490622 RepID=A0A395NM56_TRIAR|nr:trichothecene 3-o-acetyltransferase [Trichoderma arundinaceum]